MGYWSCLGRWTSSLSKSQLMCSCSSKLELGHPVQWNRSGRSLSCSMRRRIKWANRCGSRASAKNLLAAARLYQSKRDLSRVIMYRRSSNGSIVMLRAWFILSAVLRECGSCFRSGVGLAGVLVLFAPGVWSCGSVGSCGCLGLQKSSSVLVLSVGLECWSSVLLVVIFVSSPARILIQVFDNHLCENN